MTIVPCAIRCTSLLALLLVAMPAQAADASPWVRDTHSAMRLLAGSRNGAMVLGGVAFQMAPGWKTYWRTPGDSGVPPRFDFTASDNVEAVTVLWPAPMRFPDGAGGQSLGYQKQVVLPLRIVAKNAERPVTLRASVSYAVCEKLCVPVEARSELSFDGVASMNDAVLATALDTVPKPAMIGDDNPLTIRDVKRGGDGVIVDVVTPDGAATDLFVEGPTSDWALPVPQAIEHAAEGVRRFAFPLEGVPSGQSTRGAALKFTLVGAQRAYEFNVKLD